MKKFVIKAFLIGIIINGSLKCNDGDEDALDTKAFDSVFGKNIDFKQPSLLLKGKLIKKREQLVKTIRNEEENLEKTQIFWRRIFNLQSKIETTKIESKLKTLTLGLKELDLLIERIEKSWSYSVLQSSWIKLTHHDIRILSLLKELASNKQEQENIIYDYFKLLYKQCIKAKYSDKACQNAISTRFYQFKQNTWKSSQKKECDI